MKRSELRELPAGFCCCIFIFEAKNTFVAGEPPVEVHKFTGPSKGGLYKSFFHQKQAEKLQNSDFLVNLCTFMNRVRVKRLFFESLFCWGVNFIFGSSPKSPKMVNFEKRSSLGKEQGSVSSEQEERESRIESRESEKRRLPRQKPPRNDSLRGLKRSDMLSIGYMFYEDGKVVGIAVRVANAVAKYKEKTNQEPEFVEICPDNWSDDLEGVTICGLPVRVERSIPKNVIYVGRRLNREGHQ